MSAQYHHSLRFDPEECDGCMSCMRTCPTGAVRVRKGRALKLADRCIDCGECIKVCPRGAIVPLTGHMADLSKYDCTVAVPSPTLYGQFEPDISPGTIFAALKRCGFDDVQSLSPACDAVTAATEIFLSEYRGEYPLISPFCPTVVRLIQVNYPELVDQLMPILAPREVSAREAKTRIAAETGLPPDRIGTVYITPCPARMVAILEHPGMEKAHLDTAIPISDIFQKLAAAIAQTPDLESNEAGETASGVSWAFLGGFPRSLPAENTLSVAGLANVIRILDDVEKGKLRNYTFIECRACPEGCVGGALTVENPYVARCKVIKLWQRLPAGPALARADIEADYRQGAYFMDEPFTSRPLRPLDEDIACAISKMKRRDRIISGLPKIDCGACGAPSCRAFAEDVVLGEADHEACLFVQQRNGNGGHA